MITLNTEICSEEAASLSREWIETNGIGGYASGTVGGAASRRYHGVLVAATDPPVGRAVLLSKLEETLIVGDERFELSADRFPGVVRPSGFRHLVEFKLDPYPVWIFSAGGVKLEKRVVMVNGENTTITKWTRLDGPEASLAVRPLLAYRDHHHLRVSHDLDVRFDEAAGRVSFEPTHVYPRLDLLHNAVSAQATGYWYRDFEYSIEQERGFDYREDLYQPLELGFGLDVPAFVVASTDRSEIISAVEVDAMFRSETRRRAEVVAAARVTPGVMTDLTLAADQFIVSRGGGKTVIAGYHWFSDWGRDTMIALPGLTLAANRPEIAKSILAEFAQHISMGMLPNRFPDAGEAPEYNTVDATLWYFEAIRQYLDRTGDEAFVMSELFDRLVEIIDWHVRGTRYSIKVDTDGLLSAGEEGVQLTWMDAKVGDRVITPRIGKPVEIQALWFNALCVMSDLAVRAGPDALAERYSRMASIARENFNGQFWDQETGCLVDVVNGDTADRSIRPNQIFAVSLHHCMLADEHARKVVDKVESELLTDLGLRSLAPADPAYVPHYTGGPEERDSAYHQGTVWAWLMGPFVDAYARTHTADETRTLAARVESAVEQHLRDAMVGQVSEIFDADAPFAPKGCAAQAWSVAELLRVLSVYSS